MLALLVWQRLTPGESGPSQGGPERAVSGPVLSSGNLMPHQLSRICYFNMLGGHVIQSEKKREIKSSLTFYFI